MKRSKLTTDAQMALFWRILHLQTSRFGNYPMGQLLIAFTLVFLQQRGSNPTMTDLCRATGLPKSSVSRYVQWQVKQGYAKELQDPHDGRVRRLLQTAKGRKEWAWQVSQMEKIFNDIGELDTGFEFQSPERNAKELLARMIELTKEQARLQTNS